MKRIENFFPYGTSEFWKKIKLKVSMQNVILFFKFLSLIFEDLGKYLGLTNFSSQLTGKYSNAQNCVIEIDEI